MELLENDLDDLETLVESVDNNVKNNNIRLKGLNEGIEGNDLKTYLEDTFTSC